MSDTLLPFDGSVAPFTGAVASVTLTLTTPSLEVGTVGAASVAVKDADGNDLAGRTVTWASSNDTVVADPAAGVTNSAGIATVQLPALAEGTTALTAACEGISSAAATTTVFAVTTNPGYSVSGSAVVVVNCASVIKRAGRPQPRRFSDADQRRIDPTDTAFSRVRDNQNKEVVWPNRELIRRSI